MKKFVKLMLVVTVVGTMVLGIVGNCVDVTDPKIIVNDPKSVVVTPLVDVTDPH
jgi:hypothetical protein